MAVNTQKLLPASTSSALSIKTSRISVFPNQKENGGALVKSNKGALSKDILQLKTRVLKLQGQVESNRKENQKEQDIKRRNEEKEGSKKREKKLEAKPGLKGIELPNIVANLPGGSIVDAIKRYLGFTLLGWLVGKYDVLMPKLEKFLKVAKPVFEGLVGATESIFKGVYSFVETGYKAYDTVSAGIKKLGGEGAEKTFNDFSSHLNKLLNGVIIASTLIISTTPKPNKPKGKQGPPPVTGAGAATPAGLPGGRPLPPGVKQGTDVARAITGRERDAARLAAQAERFRKAADLRAGVAAAAPKAAG